jgi:hypothetical protein
LCAASNSTKLEAQVIVRKRPRVYQRKVRKSLTSFLSDVHYVKAEVTFNRKVRQSATSFISDVHQGKANEESLI